MNKIVETFPKQKEKEFIEEFLQLPAPGTQVDIENNNEGGRGNNNNNNNLMQEEREPQLRDSNQVPLTREDIFKQNLQNTQYKYTKGWILLDFPHTAHQAKLLEKQLSNFKPKDEITQTKLESNLESASLIVKSTEPVVLQRKLLRSGLDHVLNIVISKEDSIRRTIGRRFDEQSRQLYHLVDNPPPVDNAPLIERLEQIRDFETAELAIVDKNCELDNNIAKI